MLVLSRNSTRQVLKQLDLFVIALSRGLAQVVSRGLFQPKLFYDSLILFSAFTPHAPLAKQNNLSKMPV